MDCFKGKNGRLLKVEIGRDVRGRVQGLEDRGQQRVESGASDVYLQSCRSKLIQLGNTVPNVSKLLPGWLAPGDSLVLPTAEFMAMNDWVPCLLFAPRNARLEN